MTAVLVSGVSKSFRGNLVFEDVDMEVEEGTIRALVGPNGAGKSVLLKMICGFECPDAGAVRIDPRYLSEKRTFPERFGVVINGPAFLPGLSAEDNLLRLAEIRGVVGKDEILAVLTRVGLVAGRKRARHFSLGMRQKLSLAQALLEDPAILVLDEPFSALDEDSTKLVHRILIEERDKGVGIIFTSHNPHDVRQLASTVYQLGGGTLRKR